MHRFRSNLARCGFRRASQFILILLLAPAAFAVAPPTGVSIKIGHETVPPGGTLQMKVFLTEPKPIAKGAASASFGSTSLGTVLGVALFDPTGEVSGAAVSTSNGMRISFSSPAGTFGTSVDYPLITITMPVSANAPRGRSTLLTLDPATSLWLAPNGAAYPQEIKSGALNIGGEVSISNVSPGGGVPLPAGSVVTISGAGFDSSSRVTISEVSIASTQVVSPNRIDVTLGQAASMDARRVRVKTSTGSATYYSYLRAAQLGASTRPVIQASDPIYARRTYTQAALRIRRSETVFTAVALQNPGPATTAVVVDLLSAGIVKSSFMLALPGYSEFVRDVSEIFPGATDGMTVRISSAAPIQMLGLLADSGAWLVAPAEVSPLP